MFHKRLLNLITNQIHSNIHQNHSPSPQDVISDQYVTQLSIQKTRLKVKLCQVRIYLNINQNS